MTFLPMPPDQEPIEEEPTAFPAEPTSFPPEPAPAAFPPPPPEAPLARSPETPPIPPTSAAAANSTAPQPRLDPTNEMFKFLGLLREVRAGGQYLDAALASLETTLALTSEVARAATLREHAKDVADKIEDSTRVTLERLSAAESLIEASPYLRNWVGDEITKTRLNWGECTREAQAIREELLRLVADKDVAVDAGFAVNVKEARAAMRVVIVAAAMITIPPRLTEYLDEARVGATLTFKSMFEDELPDEADRTEVIRRIADAPADLPGVIDVDTASVVAISRQPWRRRRSYLIELNALLWGGVLSYLLIAASRGLYREGDFWHMTSVDAARAATTLGNLILVFAGGAFAHFLIDLIKARQGGVGAPRWMALDDWLLWLHAREVKVLGSIGALWLVFAGLMALNTGDLPDTLTMFFAGYSFDSLADVVIKRFDAFAAPQIAKVEAAVAGK